MSVLEAPVVTAPPAPGRPTLQARDLVEHLAVVVPLGLWMFPMTRATGGVDGPWAGIVLAALMVSALVLRADTRLGLPAVVLAGLISAGPLVVQATAATGWSGGQDAVGYPLFAVGALVAGSWLRGTTGDAWRARLPFLVAGLGLGLLDQVVRGLLVWYARGVTSTDVRGDFDWRNPFAAYLLPATVLAYYFLVRRSGRAWLLGALVVPFGVAGIILSTSRATQLVIVVALLAVTALALRQSTGRVGVLLRTVVVGAGSLSLVYLLTGPLAPGVAGSALAGDASREAAGETLGGNTGYRISFMKQALGVFGDHPLNGAGFDSLATAAVPHAAPGAPISTYAHGSIPQALSDGGLVLALPLCVALLVLLVRALRTVHAGLVHGRDVPLAVLAVTALGLAAHASVDFDTSRPSCALMGGVMAGAVLVGGPVRLRRPPAAASVALLAVVAVVVGGDVTARQLQVSAPYPHALVEADSVAPWPPARGPPASTCARCWACSPVTRPRRRPSRPVRWRSAGPSRRSTRSRRRTGSCCRHGWGWPPRPSWTPCSTRLPAGSGCSPGPTRRPARPAGCTTRRCWCRAWSTARPTRAMTTGRPSQPPATSTPAGPGRGACWAGSARCRSEIPSPTASSPWPLPPIWWVTAVPPWHPRADPTHGRSGDA